MPTGREVLHSSGTKGRGNSRECRSPRWRSQQGTAPPPPPWAGSRRAGAIACFPADQPGGRRVSGRPVVPGTRVWINLKPSPRQRGGKGRGAFALCRVSGHLVWVLGHHARGQKREKERRHLAGQLLAGLALAPRNDLTGSPDPSCMACFACANASPDFVWVWSRVIPLRIRCRLMACIPRIVSLYCLRQIFSVGFPLHFGISFSPRRKRIRP